jgi:hypothetical protein
MKEGDLVISLGDGWAEAGTKGIVRDVKDSGSVLVSWKSSSNPEFRPRSLFHRQRDLTLDDNWQKNPNIAFKRRKES